MGPELPVIRTRGGDISNGQPGDVSNGALQSDGRFLGHEMSSCYLAEKCMLAA